MGEIEREPSHMREGENEGHVAEEYGLSSKSIEDEGREGEIGEASRSSEKRRLPALRALRRQHHRELLELSIANRKCAPAPSRATRSRS